MDSRFEELDKNFVGAIKAVDSLVRVHDETKSCVAASESAKRTCLESRLDSLESKFDYVMHCVESLVRLHSENKSCKACASGKRQPDLGYSVNDEVKLDANLGKDLQESCKARFTKNETSPMLDMLCDAAVSSSSQLSDKTQTLSQFEKEFVKENEDRAKKEALKEIAAINNAFQCGDYVFSSNEASQNVNEVAAAVEDSRKRPRCEDENKEDDGYPNWCLVTPSSTPVEKRLSSAVEDVYCTAEELGK